VWDGSEILYEIRAPGDTGSIQMESDNYTGAFYGVVAYTHDGSIDHPLAIHKDGELVLPHENWRGAIDFGTCPIVKCDESVVQFAGSNEYVYGSPQISFNGPPSWYGSLIENQTDGSGLQYKRNRYYEPMTGRFAQEDPIGLGGGLNIYGFASGDPVNFDDPFGLCPKEAGGDGKTQSYSDCAEGTSGYNAYQASVGRGGMANNIAGAYHSCVENTVCKWGGIAVATYTGSRVAGAALSWLVGGAESAVTAGEREAAIEGLKGYGPRLTEFFKTGNLPEGVTREALEHYRTIARWAVQNADKLDKSGEQMRRLKMVIDVLRKMR
ncbi:MAG: RHS repeat-associated core domain-containing protein, partial [Actinobacteria bacterium]|nr:RHS repeat-associated core domain-containing protein [Actinomycetota bacterium]